MVVALLLFGDKDMRVRSVPTAIAVAVSLCSFPFAAQGDHLRDFTYDVLHNGDSVGYFNVQIKDEANSQTVDIAGEVEVSLGPVTLFELKHERQEFWLDDTLVKSVGRTERNGDVFDIEITLEPAGYKRTINGRTDHFDASVQVLALWHHSLFTGDKFISSYEDDVMSLSVDYQGEQEIELGDAIVLAKHYKMSGDSERDLWFDATGHVVKVKFYEALSSIEYRLDTKHLDLEPTLGVARRVSAGPPAGAALRQSMD